MTFIFPVRHTYRSDIAIIGVRLTELLNNNSVIHFPLLPFSLPASTKTTKKDFVGLIASNTF